LGDMLGAHTLDLLFALYSEPNETTWGVERDEQAA
jgi:hypothetical protein